MGGVGTQGCHVRYSDGASQHDARTSRPRCEQALPCGNPMGDVGALVRCMEFDPARVASLVLDRALRAGNISPPGEKTHEPPEPA